MINIFDNYNGITVIGNDTKGELDKDYVNFLSNSCSSDTIILTNKISIIREFSKYKYIYYIKAFNDIIDILINIKNKYIFIDVYFSSLPIPKNENNLLYRSEFIKSILNKINMISQKNLLNIVIVEQIFKLNNKLSRAFIDISSSIYIYDSDTQILKCEKSRYGSLNQEMSMVEWKKMLRLKKIERIIEEK